MKIRNRSNPSDGGEVIVEEEEPQHEEIAEQPLSPKTDMREGACLRVMASES